MAMSISDYVEVVLTVQLGQVGVLYHDYLALGSTMTKNTGAVLWELLLDPSPLTLTWRQ